MASPYIRDTKVLGCRVPLPIAALVEETAYAGDETVSDFIFGCVEANLDQAALVAAQRQADSIRETAALAAEYRRSDPMGVPSGIKKWYSLDQAMREQIAEANPVQFLCDIAMGKPFKAAPTPGRGMSTIVPTAKMRMDAAKVLTAKVLPDLSISHVEASVEVSTHEDSVKNLSAVVAALPTMPIAIDAKAKPVTNAKPIADAKTATSGQLSRSQAKPVADVASPAPSAPAGVDPVTGTAPAGEPVLAADAVPVHVPATNDVADVNHATVSNGVINGAADVDPAPVEDLLS